MCIAAISCVQARSSQCHLRRVCSWLIVRRCPFPSIENGQHPFAMWGRDKVVHKASRQKHQWVASTDDGGAMTASPAPKPSLWCPSQSTCARRQEI